VAVPAAVAAIRAVRWGWVPASDQATIATRAAEVLTGRTPRLGQLSGASAEVGLPTRSPGPMGYWPFAVTARWGPLWSSAVAAAVVSGAAMVAAVRLAARRGGPALALAVGLGLVLSARAINPSNLASTWNPALGVMPLVLLVLLAWSIGVGETALLPVAVAVASFCAQAHTALAAAAVPVLAIGAAFGLVPLLLRRTGPEAEDPSAEGRSTDDRRSAVRHLALAVVVGALCWALPLAEQVTGDPGNLTRLRRAGTGDPFPWRGAGRAVADVIGGVPAFLGGDVAPADHAQGILLRPAPAATVVIAVVVVAALVALAGLGLLRRRRDEAVPPLLVLVLLVAAGAVARSTPATSFLVLTYVLWWAVPVGMLAWVVVGRGIVVASGWGPALARPLEGRVGSVVAGLVCAAMVAVGLLAPGQPEPEEPIHAEAGAVGDAIVDRIDPGRLYLVAGQGATGSQLVASTAYRIRRAGALPVVPGNDGVAAGPRHEPQGRRCAAVVILASGDDGLPAGASVVTDLRLPARDGSSAPVVVAMAPDDGAPSC